MAINETGACDIAFDQWADCADAFKLVTGMRGVLQNKQQRLFVMAPREKRIATRIGWTVHVPTDFMIA
eukprot:7069431-Pyramimonas_sp.AAC.1